MRIENLGDYLDLAEHQTRILSGNPYSAMAAAKNVAAYDQKPSTDIVCTIRDNVYRVQGEVGDWKALQVSFPRLGVPAGSLSLKGNDPLVEAVLECENTVVPVVIDKGPLRWSGRVDVAHDRFQDGEYTVDLELIHDKAWLTRMVAWPMAGLPIQAQIPQRGVAFGNAISVIKFIIATQAQRIQLGVWELVNNLASLNFDWRSWFGTLLMWGEDGHVDFRDFMQAVHTPVYVVPTNGFTDTSPFISLNWRMDELLQLFQKTCEDNGLTIEVNLWEPGMPQPDPYSESRNLLRVPTIVVDVKDRMGVTGFSGTFLDGLQRTFVDLVGSAFGEALAPWLNPNNEYAPQGVNIAPVLGVHFIKPWVLLTDHPRGGMKEFDFAHHHPLAHTVITGGKSPKWACAPPGNRGGTSPRANLTKRRNQRNDGVGHRHADDCHRLHRRPRHHSGRRFQ